jgi:hypothetical protein
LEKALMTKRKLLRIVADSDASGGAVADGSVCLNTSPFVQFEGFPLAGGTPYIGVANLKGEWLTAPVAAEVTGAGAACSATVPLADTRIDMQLNGAPQTQVRIGIFTTEDGWVCFAAVTLYNMPALPEDFSS